MELTPFGQAVVVLAAPLLILLWIAVFAIARHNDKLDGPDPW